MTIWPGSFIALLVIVFVFGASIGGLINQKFYRVRAPKLVRNDELGQRVTKVGQAWGMLDTEDLPTHFLDTFVLRFFWYGLTVPDNAKRFDWEELAEANLQLKPAPELFHQLTGHKLSLMQLDWCAAQFFERQAKQLRSANTVKILEPEVLQEIANIKTA